MAPAPVELWECSSHLHAHTTELSDATLDSMKRYGLTRADIDRVTAPNCRNINLAAEALAVLNKYGLAFWDVVRVQTRDVWWSMAEFLRVAARIEYTHGHDCATVWGIWIVGRGWWLERENCDGYEYWELKIMPQMPLNRADPAMLQQILPPACAPVRETKAAPPQPEVVHPRAMAKLTELRERKLAL